MKINKDLADAVMMVAVIILVLVGTSTFDNPSTKIIVMASLGAITAIMAGLRIYSARQDKEEKAF